MSQASWIRGPPCGIDNCRSRLYRLYGGQKYCQFGHVMEGNLEYGEDDGESYTQTRRLNIAITDTGFGSQASTSATPQAAGITESKLVRLYGDRGRVLHFQCLGRVFQLLVPRVARELYPDLPAMELDEFCVSLDHTARLLWVRFAEAIFPGSTLPMIKDVTVLVYLALRQLNRYPVFVEDYLVILYENRVPIVNSNELIDAAAWAALPPVSFVSFTDYELPLHDTFYKLLAKWTIKLGLKHLQEPLGDAIYPLAYRLFLDLRLPHLPRLLCVLHGLNLDRGLRRRRNGMLLRDTPEPFAVALMYYALRLYLHGLPQIVLRAELKAELQKPTVAFPFLLRPFHEVSASEIMLMSEDDVSRYCDWVYDAIVPGKYKALDTTELSLVERRVNRFFPFERKGWNKSALKARGLEPLALVDNKLSHAELGRLEALLMRYLLDRYGLRQLTLRKIVQHITQRHYFAEKYKGLFKRNKVARSKEANTEGDTQTNAGEPETDVEETPQTKTEGTTQPIETATDGTA